MNDSIGKQWRSSGFRRLIRAVRYQSEGIRQGLLHDPAIRGVSIACMALSIVGLLLPVSRVERLLLILSLMLVVVVEYLNSAIEATVDRISTEPNSLSKNAKDFGSVAVGLSALMALLTWLVVSGPVLITWLGEFVQ